MRTLMLVQAPEGAPNFCFGFYDAETGECLDFIQSDWDWAGMASTLGWCPCECGCTDGTVPCAHRTTSEMLASAFDYLAERDRQVFELSDW
jgi:hypothetical protein